MKLLLHPDPADGNEATTPPPAPPAAAVIVAKAKPASKATPPAKRAPAIISKKAPAAGLPENSPIPANVPATTPKISYGFFSEN